MGPSRPVAPALVKTWVEPLRWFAEAKSRTERRGDEKATGAIRAREAMTKSGRKYAVAHLMPDEKIPLITNSSGLGERVNFVP